MSETRPEGDAGDVAGVDGVEQLQGLRATLSAAGRLGPKDGEPAGAFRLIAELGRGREPPLTQPVAVALAADSRVVALQPDGELSWVLERFGPPGAAGEDEEFYEPYSLCLADGRLWVADTNNNRVLTFDSQRRLLNILTPGAFVLPSGVRAR